MADENSSNSKVTEYLKNFDSYIENAKLHKKDYQREGVSWMLERELSNGGSQGVRGGLIADEMGLGKTIMTIGTIVSYFKRRTLIIVPPALLDQWESEIYKTTGHRALVFHGSKKNKVGTMGFIGYPELINASIVISTYGHIQTKKDSDDFKILHRIPWDRVIFDEAHHLRTSNTQRFYGALKIKSPIRWLITGTPIQNKKADFYSLCAVMGYKSDFYTLEENLIPIVRNSIMKRTKKQVGIQLPDITTEDINVDWANEAEKNFAEDIHTMLHFSKVNSQRQVNNAISALDNGYLPLLVRARQSCIYPGLMKKNIKSFLENGLIDEEDVESLKLALENSSKLRSVCNTIIKNKDLGSKLVFCHYRGEIDFIERELKSKGLDVNTFDGRTAPSQKNEILTNPCDVLILQIKTGCEGLNLQHFKEVYFVSPHWNPAVEDQAIARCHRIGQRDDVRIYKFQMAGFDKSNDTRSLDNYSSQVQNMKREIYNIID